MTRIQRTSDERRAEIKANAAAMGIDEAYISVLVDTFYASIREHETLGPIFNEKIGEEWDDHLIKLKAFWSSVALNSGTYSGRPVPAHIQLTEVRPPHFEEWLGLFKKTLEETAPSPAAVLYFYERAERIAKSLQLAMFGLDKIPGPISSQ